MRRIYRWDAERGRMYEVVWANPGEHGPEMMPDIAPYRSMITGEMITGRRQHREHLKRHDCQEVGNERMVPQENVQFDQAYREQVRNDIREAERQVTWDEAPTLERLRQMTLQTRRELGLDE